VPLATTPLLQQLHQASGTAAALRALCRQPVDEQVEGHLPLGKDMVDEPRGEPGDLQRDVDDRAGQRGDRDPGAVGAVDRLEEAGAVDRKAIEHHLSALRDRDLEPGLDVGQAPEQAGRPMRRNAIGRKAARHLRLFPRPWGPHATKHPVVDGFPVLASPQPAPLAGRHAHFHCLMTSDEAMLSSAKTQ
jgi:hypothetical protein